MAFTTVPTAPGSYQVQIPYGFEPLSRDAVDIRPFKALSGVAYVKGKALQFSGGYAVLADANTTAGEIIGICDRTFTGTATGDASFVNVDIGITKGHDYKVLMSDGTPATTDEGAGAKVGENADRILQSAATTGNGVFIITRIFDTTNKIAAVKINQGYNA